MNPGDVITQPAIILPLVRGLTICHSVQFDPDRGLWLLLGPQSVEFLPDGASFPLRLSELGVYALLTGGLGVIRFGLEIRQRLEEPGATEIGYRLIGSSVSTDPYSFDARANRLQVHGVPVHRFPVRRRRGLRVPDRCRYRRR